MDVVEFRPILGQTTLMREPTGPYSPFELVAVSFVELHAVLMNRLLVSVAMEMVMVIAMEMGMELESW